MTHKISKEEEALQVRAEALEQSHAPACSDPAIEAYRQIIRAARQAPLPHLPASFAQQIAARVESYQQQALLDWCVPVSAIIISVIVGLITSTEVLVESAQHLLESGALALLPWRLLLAAGAAIAMIAAIDKWLIQHR